MTEPNTDRRALADELKRLIEERQATFVFESIPTGFEIAAAQHFRADVSRRMGDFIGTNWPTIIQALRGETP